MASIPFREKAFYEFGHFRLDAAERALYYEGQLIPLAPKAFDTLLALVEGEGKVVENLRFWAGATPSN